MSYEDDMYIDSSALDVEWLEQPKLMMKYTALVAKAEKTVEIIMEKKGIVKSELDKDIRLNPKKFKLHNLEKLTESIILSTIHKDKEYRSVRKKLIEAQYEKKMAEGAVRACSQRKDALENMVRLLGQQYFAGPSVPRDLNTVTAKKERQKRVDKGVKISRKRND